MRFELPPTPTALTLDVLAQTPDDILESVILNYVLSLTSARPDDELLILGTLPAGLRAHYLAFLVDIEVLNGGFNQYFFNSSGLHGPATPAAFQHLGMPQAAEIMTTALRLYAEAEAGLDDARDEGTMDAFMDTYEDDPFELVDDAYCDSQDAFREARLRFIREHPEQFVHPL